MNKIIVIQGAQYGSEAKGAIAALICEEEKVDIAVRTGATNAGHTVYYHGRAVKMQQLPTGWVNPATKLVLGAGALIDPVILDAECRVVGVLTGEDIRRRLVIDYRAGVHNKHHAERSKASGRHHAIGATGKGCSEALIDRIKMRGRGGQLFGQIPESQGYDLADTAMLLNGAYDTGAKILLEGTQGTLLDLYLGPYPYTTHKQTGPGQWMLECGLSPALATDIVQVVRTYPIRVAGNSGPMSMETSWPWLARHINDQLSTLGRPDLVNELAIAEFEAAVESVASSMPTALPHGSNGLDQHLWSTAQRESHKEALSELNKFALSLLDMDTLTEISRLFEFTTVTKKLRRVSHLDTVELRKSSLLTRPHRVAVTFMNYVFPQYWFEVPGLVPNNMHNYLDLIEVACDAKVDYIGFGPESKHHVAYRR